MSLAESGFDPLSRTCRFMLMEEAHHMMVGVNGISRIVQRTLEVMKEFKTDAPDKVRAAGAIDLPTIQRYLNFWFSSSLDLFGAEVSTNAASYFVAGIKGRPDEGRYDDHRCLETALAVEMPGGVEQVPLRNAMNDCAVGVRRWHKFIEEAGYDFRLALPSPRFNRSLGAWSGVPVDPAGKAIGRPEWERHRDEWLPALSDRDFVKSLMKPVTVPGEMAGWIAPPDRGINKLAVEHEYVRWG